MLYDNVELMPYFANCENLESGSEEKRHCSNLALVNYISENIRYPESARLANVEGTVYASFVVDEEGMVSNPVILKDIGEGCAQASIDVIENMPKWEPGIHNGNTVAVKLTVPIRFYMEEEEPDLSSNYKFNWGNLKGENISKEELVNHLNRPILIRDSYGEKVSISTLHFAYKKRRKFRDAKSTGRITNEMKELVHKIRRGGAFAVKATIQKKGELIDVVKVYEIEKK